MKWDPKRFGWRKVLCLLELSRAYQPSNTIHTSERRRGAASHLAKADRERLPEVQRNNAGIQTQANLEESRCSECQRPESGGGGNKFLLQQDSNVLPSQRWSGLTKRMRRSLSSLKRQIRFPEKICGMTRRLSRICEVQMCWADADVPERELEESCDKSLVVMIVILLTADQVTMCAVKWTPRGDKLSPRLCRVF